MNKILILAFVIGLVAGESKTCTYSNACIGESGTPYCINGQCRACKSNIDCSPGSFCRTGSCVSASSGRSCNSLQFEYDGNPIFPTMGQDDQQFCGSLIYVSSSQIDIEWMGFCIRGKCAECIPDYDLSLVDEKTATFFRKYWDRTLMFPGTICENSQVVNSKSDLRSQLSILLDLPLAVGGSIIGLLLMICCLLTTIVMCYYNFSRKKQWD